VKTPPRNGRRGHATTQVLESRIAPAVFFVEANGSIVNSIGASANNSAAAALAAGADTHLGKSGFQRIFQLICRKLSRAVGARRLRL
jgi:hypothetical protein